MKLRRDKYFTLSDQRLKPWAKWIIHKKLNSGNIYFEIWNIIHVFIQPLKNALSNIWCRMFIKFSAKFILHTISKKYMAIYLWNPSKSKCTSCAQLKILYDNDVPFDYYLTQPLYLNDLMTWTRFPRYWPLCGAPIGDRWIPLTKARDVDL